LLLFKLSHNLTWKKFIQHMFQGSPAPPSKLVPHLDITATSFLQPPTLYLNDNPVLRVK
jgi:hypothetical protein